MAARRLLVTLAICGLAFALPSGAHGAVTIGSSLASEASFGFGCAPPPTYIQTALPGRVLASPMDGVITRWRIRYAQSFPAFESPQLRVLRPVAGGHWVGSGTSAFAPFPAHSTLGGDVTETAVRLPVKTGDMLGLDAPDGSDASPSALFAFASQPDASLSSFEPLLRDGEERGTGPGCFQGVPYELLVNADIEPDADRDGLGDETQDDDPDGDGLAGAKDNCPSIANADQRDTDGDGLGDACEADADGDGVPSVRDNCPSLATANQADLDGDGQGDACDRDDDGDGVSDATEATIGTNPRSADSDGDGLGDLADRCPVQAGSVDGCPSARESSPLLQDVPARMKLATFLKKGVPVRFSASAPMEVDFELRASVRTTAIAAAARRFELTLARGSLGFGTGARSVVLRPSRRLVGRARRFRVVLSSTATARDGSRLSLTQSIRVTP